MKRASIRLWVGYKERTLSLLRLRLIWLEFQISTASRITSTNVQLGLATLVGAKRGRLERPLKNEEVPSLMESGNGALQWVKSLVRRARNAEPAKGDGKNNGGKKRNRKNKPRKGKKEAKEGGKGKGNRKNKPRKGKKEAKEGGKGKGKARKGSKGSSRKGKQDKQDKKGKEDKEDKKNR